ncbi:MAG TPA: serine/threonine-protein kinase [Pseudonocardiaceae bacterium]|jgi:serine/threonine-protein kinase
MPLTIGELIAERYRLMRRIAIGGMGEVWEASDTRLARRVAIKVLKAELSGTQEFLHRFRAEARATASLNHPGIAAVHDYGEAAAPDGPTDAYLVMELVEGEPLAAMIARRRRLSPERTLDVLEQAGHALQAAHQRGLVHRDVKPANILLTATGGVKLTDFGIARAVDAAPLTRSGMVMGTAHYIAPEQAAGQEAGPASDVYSLGVVGYECLTGHRPFRSDSAVTVALMHMRDAPPPLPPDVPPGVRALIDAALVKDPRSRYHTGGEFALAVAAVRAGRPLPRPGSAALRLPPGRALPAFGAPSTPGSPAGDPPTSRQPRYGRHRSTVPAAGPPTPNPPGSGPPSQPPPDQPPADTSPAGTSPGVRAAHSRRLPSQPRLGPWLLVGLLLVIVLAITAWVLVTVLDRAGANPGGPGPTTEPQAAQTPQQTSVRSSQGVTVKAADYLDEPAANTADDLTGHGLRPEVLDQDGQPPADPTTCLVTDVSPTGIVPLGSSVTVSCRQQSG